MDPSTFAILLAAQAAGMAISWYDSKQKRKMAHMGYNVEHAGIEANMEMTKAAAADESLQSIKRLNAALGSQTVVQAARGTSTEQGTGQMLMQKSTGDYNRDEKIRSLNLSAKMASLMATDANAALKLLQVESKISYDLANEFTNRVAAVAGGAPQYKTQSTYTPGQGQPPYRKLDTTETRSGGSYGLREGFY